MNKPVAAITFAAALCGTCFTVKRLMAEYEPGDEDVYPDLRTPLHEQQGKAMGESPHLASTR